MGKVVFDHIEVKKYYTQWQMNQNSNGNRCQSLMRPHFFILLWFLMLLLRVPPPSFLTFPELENGKSDWAETFTIDRARKIRGPVFERFFFL